MMTIGKTKHQIRSELSQQCLNDQGFMKWFEDRFMKYDGVADHEDARVLLESIDTVERASSPSIGN